MNVCLNSPAISVHLVNMPCFPVPDHLLALEPEGMIICFLSFRPISIYWSTPGYQLVIHYMYGRPFSIGQNPMRYQTGIGLCPWVNQSPVPRSKAATAGPGKGCEKLWF